MVYYVGIVIVAAIVQELTGSSALAFWLAIILFGVKLLILGPEPDDNG